MASSGNATQAAIEEKKITEAVYKAFVVAKATCTSPWVLGVSTKRLHRTSIGIECSHIIARLCTEPPGHSYHLQTAGDHLGWHFMHHQHTHLHVPCDRPSPALDPTKGAETDCPHHHVCPALLHHSPVCGMVLPRCRVPCSMGSVD